MGKRFPCHKISEGCASAPAIITHERVMFYQVRPEDGIYDRTFSEEEVIDVGFGAVEPGDLAPNGSQLRPHIVFFGEAVPKIERAIDCVQAADLMLIVGTSLAVYPAAGLYRYARAGVPVYLIDPEEVALYDKRIVQIRDVATRGMARFTDMLREKGF